LGIRKAFVCPETLFRGFSFFGKRSIAEAQKMPRNAVSGPDKVFYIFSKSL